MHIDIDVSTIRNKKMGTQKHKICIAYNQGSPYPTVSKVRRTQGRLHFGVHETPVTIMPSAPQKDDKRRAGKGLCQNCALLATCSWYRDDAVIFHCEHYQ